MSRAARSNNAATRWPSCRTAVGTCFSSTVKILVLATGNPHKVRELSELLLPLPVRLASLADYPATTPVEEDGATPAENARQKASGYARQLQQWVLADDTALHVDALHGAPGVRSARYAGPHATMARIVPSCWPISHMLPDDERTARFVCHLAIADPAGRDRGWSRQAYAQGGSAARRAAGALRFRIRFAV